MRSQHLSVAHATWKAHIRPGDLIIDATCGNGYDTLLLAKLLQGSGTLVAYDIQKQALEKTSARLLELSDEERAVVCLKEASHASFSEREAALIVYNLGYLPGGDKSITTESSTTLQSLSNALSILKPGGLLSITCYPGHEEGEREERDLIIFLSTLPSSEWTVSHQRWLNRTKAPSLLLVARSS